MTGISSLISSFRDCALQLTSVVRSNGGFALHFVVLMIVLNVAMVAAGAAFYLMGDHALLDAAGRSALLVGPVLTVATALLTYLPRSERA